MSVTSKLLDLKNQKLKSCQDIIGKTTTKKWKGYTHVGDMFPHYFLHNVHSYMIMYNKIKFIVEAKYFRYVKHALQ